MSAKQVNLLFWSAFVWLSIFLPVPACSQETATIVQVSSPAEPRLSSTQAKPAPRRVVDGPIKRRAVLRLGDALKYPFTLFGAALHTGTRKIEKEHMLERVQDLNQRLLRMGYQPLFGGLGRGAGFSVGVNIFREKFLGSRIRLDVPIEYSTNRYAGLGGYLTFPILSGDKLFFKAGFEYQDRPQEDFFGLGPGSRERDRSNFELEKRTAVLSFGSRLGKNIVLEFPVRFLSANLSRGTDNRFPDLQDRFSVSEIPGAEKGAELFSAGGSVEWDYRNSATNPTGGGIWRLEAIYFRDTESQDFRFMRYTVETAQYLPLDDEHLFAIRALGVFNDEKGKSDVPFFMKAILGGKDTMRGFREFRFSDDNALLFSVEYRWQIWKFADAVLFVDEGQVGREPGDFSLDGFRNSHGAGLRFKSTRGQLFRVDVGHSKEGWRLYISFSPAF